MSRRVHLPPADARSLKSKSGQALLETFGIIMLLCLILFGMVQYVLMLTATEVIQYSADASARARAVGFNYFMVRKVSEVTTIPNAGRLDSWSGVRSNLDDWWNTQSAGSAFDNAITSNPGSNQWTYEQTTIPLYLGSGTYGEARGYLDYERWWSGSDPEILPPIYSVSSVDMVEVNIRQNFELRMPFFSAFSDDEQVDLRAESRLADHAELYLE